MTCVLAITLMAGFPAVKAYAASGTVYSCTINRCYAHPVTGVIEDSGGESSYATGQGMVEGCVYSNGILEVSDDGAYYLTIRMSLMDYTSGHSFQVQNVGDSGWSTQPAREKIMVIARRTADAFFKRLFIIVLCTSPTFPVLTEEINHSGYCSKQNQTCYYNCQCNLKNPVAGRSISAIGIAVTCSIFRSRKT